MVQRSSTCVVSSESITDIGLKGLYDENGPSVDDADLWLFAFPSSLFKAQQVKLTAVQNAHDRATLDGLKAAGFALDNGPNDAGLLMKYFHRGGGYYIDVGASQLIIDGKIRIKQGQEIKQILPNGLEFVDGDNWMLMRLFSRRGIKICGRRRRLYLGRRLQAVWVMFGGLMMKGRCGRFGEGADIRVLVHGWEFGALQVLFEDLSVANQSY
jgi:hypothetical protein